MPRALSNLEIARAPIQQCVGALVDPVEVVVVAITGEPNQVASPILEVKRNEKFSKEEMAPREIGCPREGIS